MRTFRALAVVTTAAGLLTGLPLSNALACDNDRFPCPIVSDAPEHDRGAVQGHVNRTGAQQEGGTAPG